MRSEQQYILLIYTRPTSGMENEYHRWYDSVHLAEVLCVPGFVQAQRLAVCESTLTPPQRAGEYVAAYTIKSDDIVATLAAFDQARMRMNIPPSLDRTSVVFQLLRML